MCAALGCKSERCKNKKADGSCRWAVGKEEGKQGALVLLALNMCSNGVHEEEGRWVM
jgi:hypothetical protein